VTGPWRGFFSPTHQSDVQKIKKQKYSDRKHKQIYWIWSTVVCTTYFHHRKNNKPKLRQHTLRVYIPMISCNPKNLSFLCRNLACMQKRFWETYCHCFLYHILHSCLDNVVWRKKSQFVREWKDGTETCRTNQALRKIRYNALGRMWTTRFHEQAVFGQQRRELIQIGEIDSLKRYSSWLKSICIQHKTTVIVSGSYVWHCYICPPNHSIWCGHWLTSLTLPNTLTSVGARAFLSRGSWIHFQ